MAYPYHHALSSVKKWGGTVDDFIAVHAWFDQSKEITADFRHRALRHHAEGTFMAVTWTGKYKDAGVLVRNRPTAALPKKLAVVGLFCVRDGISFQFLAEVGQELFNSSCDGAVTFDFARPRTSTRVVSQRQFQSTAFAQPWRIARRRYETRTAQVKVTFAWALRGQAQTMPEFQRSFEEVAAQPVDRAFAKISGSDRFCSRTCNHGARFQNGLTVAQHLCVADPRISNSTKLRSADCADRWRGSSQYCDADQASRCNQYRVFRRSPVRLSAPISTKSCRSRVVVARDVPVMEM